MVTGMPKASRPLSLVFWEAIHVFSNETCWVLIIYISHTYVYQGNLYGDFVIYNLKFLFMLKTKKSTMFICNTSYVWTLWQFLYSKALFLLEQIKIAVSVCRMHACTIYIDLWIIIYNKMLKYCRVLFTWKRGMNGIYNVVWMLFIMWQQCGMNVIYNVATTW